MTICKALLKYRYNAFKLEILEYCSLENLLEREQYYIDKYNPEYNILKFAGSSLGFKHSEATKEIMSKLAKGRTISTETLLKMKNKKVPEEVKLKISNTLKNRKVSIETRELISKAKLGQKPSKETLLKMALNNNKRQSITLINLETNLSKNFLFMKEAAEFLGTSHTQIRNYINRNKPYKGYKIILSNDFDNENSLNKTQSNELKYKSKYFNFNNLYMIILCSTLITLSLLSLSNIINEYLIIFENIHNKYISDLINIRTHYLEYMLNHRTNIYSYKNSELSIQVIDKLNKFCIPDSNLEKLKHFFYKEDVSIVKSILRDLITLDFKEESILSPTFNTKNPIINPLDPKNLPILRLEIPNKLLYHNLLSEGINKPKHVLNYESNLLFALINNLSPGSIKTPN